MSAAGGLLIVAGLNLPPFFSLLVRGWTALAG